MGTPKREIKEPKRFRTEFSAYTTVKKANPHKNDSCAVYLVVNIGCFAKRPGFYPFYPFAIGATSIVT